MTTRVTLEMRQALEAEAERSGRTIGQVAQHWLEQARALNALGPSAPALNAMIGQMLRFAAEVSGVEGDPRYSVEARATLREGLRLIAEAAFPRGRDPFVITQIRFAALQIHNICQNTSRRLLPPAAIMRIVSDLTVRREHPPAIDEKWISSREQVEAAARDTKDPLLAGYLMLLGANMRLTEAELSGRKSEGPGLSPEERARRLLHAVGVRPLPVFEVG